LKTEFGIKKTFLYGANELISFKLGRKEAVGGRLISNMRKGNGSDYIAVVGAQRSFALGLQKKVWLSVRKD
jgi:hypothetical protein